MVKIAHPSHPPLNSQHHPLSTGLACPKTVQKYFKKLLTLFLPFGIVDIHTVTNSKKMRTKTLLLSAVALAAGLVSSQAQNVYSANIVGYVNIISLANSNTPVVNPLDLDGVNNITNVLANSPGGTLVQIWNGAGFDAVSRSSFGSHAWSASAATNNIPPGKGFFLKTPVDFTNVFVGNVVPSNGATNSLALTGGVLQFVGSVLPVGGSITNDVDQGTNALNLGSTLAKGSIIQVWNGSGYTAASRGSFGAGTWSSNLTFSVGEAFFVKAGASSNWNQTLNVQ
jgi:hypothetical protein